MKQTINTENFMLQTSQAGNSFFKTEDGKVVIVNKAIAAKWESLDEVTINEVHYEKRRNRETNELIDEPWSRLEVVAIKDVNSTISKRTKRLEAANAYAKAKDASLKMTDLSPSVVKELEALLA